MIETIGIIWLMIIIIAAIGLWGAFAYVYYLNNRYK